MLNDTLQHMWQTLGKINWNKFVLWIRPLFFFLKKKKRSVLEGWEKWNLVNKYQINFVRDKKNGILLIKIRYVL